MLFENNFDKGDFKVWTYDISSDTNKIKKFKENLVILIFEVLN